MYVAHCYQNKYMLILCNVRWSRTTLDKHRLSCAIYIAIFYIKSSKRQCSSKNLLSRYEIQRVVWNGRATARTITLGVVSALSYKTTCIDMISTLSINVLLRKLFKLLDRAFYIWTGWCIGYLTTQRKLLASGQSFPERGKCSGQHVRN